MARRRGAGPALLVAAALLLAGCEDSAAGFTAGIGEAIFLLLFVAVVLPTIVAGLVVLVVVWARRNRDRSGPP
jgi:hypothetical protein